MVRTSTSPILFVPAGNAGSVKTSTSPIFAVPAASLPISAVPAPSFTTPVPSVGSVTLIAVASNPAPIGTAALPS